LNRRRKRQKEKDQMTTFSRHVNEQYRWTEALLSRLKDLHSSAASFKMTQADYLTRRAAIWTAEKRLTSDRAAYVDGYMRALEDIRLRSLFHVRRIVGRPDTASSAKWDDMTEDLRQACRDHNTESCLAWDADGAHPFGPWSKE
jgi:hypothetical protein